MPQAPHGQPKSSHAHTNSTGKVWRSHSVKKHRKENGHPEAILICSVWISRLMPFGITSGVFLPPLRHPRQAHAVDVSVQTHDKQQIVCLLLCHRSLESCGALNTTRSVMQHHSILPSYFTHHHHNMRKCDQDRLRMHSDALWYFRRSGWEFFLVIDVYLGEFAALTAAWNIPRSPHEFECLLKHHF